MKSETFFVPSLSNKPLVTVEILEGGFGYVHIVDSEDGIKFAFKTLKNEFEINEELFFREANKLLEIPPHQNIIQLIGVFKHKDNPFLCMPYCESTLRNLMKGGLTKNPQIEKIVIDITKGLDHIHNGANILHLDLKPENILLDNSGNFLISDFGTSKAFPEITSTSLHNKLFLSGLTGTITYMSPEHFVSQELSDKSDIFSLGIILYELITGKHPFLKDTVEDTIQNVLYKQISFGVIGTFKYPKILRQLCLAALNKNPEDRPSSKEILDYLTSNAHYKLTIKNSFDYGANINRAVALMGAAKLGEVAKIVDAEALLNECISENPFYMIAHLNLAEVYYLQGKHQQAIDKAEKLLKLKDWKYYNIGTLGSLYLNLSTYFLSVNPSTSISLAKKALEIEKDDWQALGNLAEAFRVLGESKNGILKEAKLEEAITYCDKALKLNPNDLKLRVTQGGIYLAQDNLKDLVPLVEKLANEAINKDLGTRILVIRLFIRIEKIENAIETLKPLREIKGLEDIVETLEIEIEEMKNGLNK